MFIKNIHLKSFKFIEFLRKKYIILEAILYYQNIFLSGTDTTISTITIFRTRSEDSGNYTCSPSNLDSASAYLHVLNGK